MADAGVTADLVTYNTIICHWARAGLPEEAEKWIRKMVALGIRPDDKSLGAMVIAYAKLREVNFAERYIEEMKERSLKLNQACYHFMLEAYMAVEDGEKVKQWREAMHRAGFQPWCNH